MQSVARAVALLNAVAAAPEPQSAPDLAEACAINRSTAWRILATLEEEGLIERDANNRYLIGYGVARLAAAAGDDSIARVARPYLVDLASTTGETASLAVPRQLQLVYVDQVQAPHVMAPDWLSRAVPMHATSTGKALLAMLTPEDLSAVLAAPLQRFNERTVTDPDQLREALGEVRQRGYAVSEGELEAGLWGASSAVLDQRHRVIAVVSVWGAQDRVLERGLDVLGRATAVTARAIEGAVGL